jgi:hypothetical protein
MLDENVSPKDDDLFILIDPLAIKLVVFLLESKFTLD